jgi:xylulokinase
VGTIIQFDRGVVMARFLLGFDVGSSSVKAALLDAESGECAARALYPKSELGFISSKPGFAEQNPDDWWECIKKASALLKKQCPAGMKDVTAIGVSAQMHGLVVIDRNLQPLRLAIIWNDSRAVPIGEKALEDLGKRYCLNHFLNSPGNFTASRLKWVKDNEPEVFSRIFKLMFPCDYLAMKMTGEIKTTASSLSEGILWDYIDDEPAHRIMEYFGFPEHFIPQIIDSFSSQGELTSEAAKELGLKEGIPITYRSGDQQNNAFSLNVLYPGEIAAKAGTSGVVYGISKRPVSDPRFRMNTFVHVNHSHDNPRYGILHCVNGVGSLNKWMRENILHQIKGEADYSDLNRRFSQIAPGAEGMIVLPYGNGAERSLGNLNIGMSVHGLNHSIHTADHLIRASCEGIIYSMNYGIEIMRDMGIEVSKIRVVHAGMFQHPDFCEAFATVTSAKIELYDADGAQGAARAAGIGLGLFKNYEQAFNAVNAAAVVTPKAAIRDIYAESYAKWKKTLGRFIGE